MERRRGSPPPPPRGRPPTQTSFGGRDPRGGDPFARDRDFERRGRARSPSPVYDRYGRGPRDSPPYNGVSKRYRRDEPPYGRDQSPPRGAYPRSPSHRAVDDRSYDDRRGPRDIEDRSDNRRMMTFKEFMFKQPDDPSPEEAQARYKEYKTEFHGGKIKAEFFEKKDDEATRNMFDPRIQEKLFLKRNEDARESAKQFAADIDAGLLDTAADGFNQGMFGLAPAPEAAKAAAVPMDTDKGEPSDGAVAKTLVEGPTKTEGEPAAEKPVFAPAVCWRPARVAVDIKLATKLVRKLDAEKQIESNPLLPSSPSEVHVPAATTEGASNPETMDTEEGGAAKEPVPADAGAKIPEPDAEGQGDQPPPAEAPDVDAVDEGEDPVTLLSRLDLLLTYLWRVHGVDYYAGYELTPSEFPQRLTESRILRAPQPEEGEGGDEAEDKRNLELVERTVNDSFEKRLAESEDPMEAKLQLKRIEEAIEKWVEDQVIMVAENKWGNKISPKMFMAKKFVLKHVRSKHEDKVQKEKDKILDEIYFENFKAYKEEEEARANEAATAQGSHEGADIQGGHPGRGRGGRIVARGGGHFPGMMGGRGRGGGRMIMMDPSMMMGGGMMPFMPGAGPMGPMIMIPTGAGMAPMMAPMMMGGRGMRGGGGGRMGGGMVRGRGGRGSSMIMMPGGGMREYYDLDSPQNNRAVLDYGDL